MLGRILGIQISETSQTASKKRSTPKPKLKKLLEYHWYIPDVDDPGCQHFLITDDTDFPFNFLFQQRDPEHASIYYMCHSYSFHKLVNKQPVEWVVCGDAEVNIPQIMTSIKQLRDSKETV